MGCPFPQAYSIRFVSEYAVENWKDIKQVDIGYTFDSTCLIPDAECDGVYYVGLQEDARVILHLIVGVATRADIWTRTILSLFLLVPTSTTYSFLV